MKKYKHLIVILYVKILLKILFGAEPPLPYFVRANIYFKVHYLVNEWILDIEKILTGRLSYMCAHVSLDSALLKM